MTEETSKNFNELRNSIDALESRNAFQDDVIEQLNNELSVHQLEISALKSQLKLIASRIKDNNNTGQSQSQDIEPPPPHY